MCSNLTQVKLFKTFSPTVTTENFLTVAIFQFYMQMYYVYENCLYVIVRTISVCAAASGQAVWRGSAGVLSLGLRVRNPPGMDVCLSIGLSLAK